uniref:Uncharacterized protein n=1 Tax=Anguilla anguilla TaxID=7936 RepID=A0A0E9UW04_ANGAN
MHFFLLMITFFFLRVPWGKKGP